MNSYLENIIKLLQDDSLPEDKKQALLTAVKDADKQWAIADFKLERTEKVKRTTAILLEETIEELEQKRKAVEAQNRELEIETALERVRARTMAMQKSDELKDVIRVVYDQFVYLNILTEHTGFIIDYKERDDMHIWLADQHAVPSQITIPYFDSPHWNSFNEAKEKGKDFFANHLSFDEKNKFYQDLFQLIPGVTDEAKQYYLGCPGLAISTVLLENVGLYIENFSGIPYTDEENNTLMRFGKVFQQTYTRFLDLQKAEAQAKESQIEAALERVRSRSMAMHKSEELADLSLELVKQVQALGVATWFCAFNIYDDDPKGSLEWGSNGQGTFPRYRTPRERIFLHYYTAGQRGESLLIHEIGENECPAHYDYLCTLPGVGEQLLKMKAAGISFPAFQIDHVAYFKYGYILFITYKPVPESHDIFKRFAKVFEQTYTRFLDLQKAEAQAKEAKIETALERVRSKTMAMHNSEDVGDTVATMFDELVKLGVKTVRCGVGIMHDRNQMELWTAKKNETGKAELVIGRLDMTIHPLLQGVYNGWKNKDITFSYDLKGKDLVDYFTVLINSPDYHINYDINSLPQRQFHNAFYFTEGVLFSFFAEQLSAEASQIFKRFAGVFGQTYRRFLDLQKAEAQAREAQIETALERIRSRTMAMHQTSELQEVIHTVHKELLHLKLSIDGGSFVVINEDVGPALRCWGSGGTANTSEEVEVPTFDMAFGTNLVKGIKEGPGFFTEQFSQQEKKEFFTKLFEHKPWSELDSARKEETLSGKGGYTRSVAVSKHTSIFIINHHGKNFTEAENDILKRFAKVFEQTYTRFLDLQKAEAQAREAKIEASLERVRAKAMAMQNSDELGDLVTILFDELTKLDMVLARCIIWIFDNNNFSSRVWMANSEDKKSAESYFIKPLQHPYYEAIIQGWQQRVQKWVYDLKGAEKKSIDELLLNETELAGLPASVKKGIRGAEHTIVSGSFNNFGLIEASGPIALSEEQMEILSRFAKVFDLTYTRFNDLQHAEAQAREATIEAALEKVRGKAMAMHNSNDLSVTTSMVITELRKLGITPIRCGVGIVDKEKQKAQLYAARSSPEGDTLAVVGWAVLKTHPILETIYKNWVAGEDYFPELSGDSLRSYYQQLLAGLSVPLPNFTEGEKHYGHFLSVSVGCLYAWSLVRYNDEEIKILKRFASIIDLTFRRYFELQQAEENAKEAVKQAALDRIRADIASMRTISDLDRITPLIWNELTTLGIPFIRCGVFIMDNVQELIHTFLSTPEGKAIAAFHLPYDTPGNIRKVLGHWRSNQMYIDHWDESSFTELAAILVQQKAIASPGQYLNTIPSGGFFLHFLPFLQGMLYVGNTSQLNEEEVNLIQSVADAFSTAYARYEDFNKLEAAKQTVENTLVDLKQAQAQLIQSEKMASLGELTAGIAHEIQNPLNFVNNFSEVNKELLEEMKEAIEKGNMEEVKAIANDVIDNQEKINHHGKRADAIVKGMLQHSRSSSSAKEPTNINTLADEYLRLAYHGLRAKNKSFNATMKTDFDESIGSINMIPQDIGRVILNLITNAFYAVSEKKKQQPDGYEPVVSVETEKINGKVEVSVKDNGNGIPGKALEKIFQPFFTTKPTGQGTGLGLSLSYDIVKAHGGELTVKTKEGEGSTFIIQLPVQTQ